MVCPERGALSSVIHNETVEMDNEMVVTILKDVAMGMKFLHFSKTPSQDEELTPNRILLDANYRAQLMHFQLQAVCSQRPDNMIVKTIALVGLQGCLRQAALKGRDLSCMYLAHHELDSICLLTFVTIIDLTIVLNYCESPSHAALMLFIVMARASLPANVVCLGLTMPEVAESCFSALL